MTIPFVLSGPVAMKHLSTFSLLIVAACGNSGGGTNATDPVTVSSTVGTIGNNPTTATFDSTNDEIIVENTSGSMVALATSASNNTGSFLGYRNNREDIIGFRAISGSGDSVALLVGDEGLSGTLKDEFARLSDTALPVMGSAHYTGDYVAFVMDGSNTDIDLAITGDVSLMADFADMSVNGSITNRVGRAAEGLSVENSIVASDLTFTAGTLDAEGAFSGQIDTSGIYTDGTGSYAPDGTYAGLISGADAGEVVGGVNIVWTEVGGTATRTESGVFIAD